MLKKQKMVTERGGVATEGRGGGLSVKRLPLPPKVLHLLFVVCGRPRQSQEVPEGVGSLGTERPGGRGGGAGGVCQTGERVTAGGGVGEGGGWEGRLMQSVVWGLSGTAARRRLPVESR